MQSFYIRNGDTKPINVIIAPWDRSYRLEAGKTMNLQQSENLEGNYHLTVFKNGNIQVLVEGQYGIPKISVT